MEINKMLSNNVILFYCMTCVFLSVTKLQGFVPTSSFSRGNRRYRQQDLCMSLPSSDLSLDPEETAFVFIEYQNEFTTEGGKLHDAVKDVMDKTNIHSSHLYLASILSTQHLMIIIL